MARQQGVSIFMLILSHIPTSAKASGVFATGAYARMAADNAGRPPALAARSAP